MSSLLLLVIGMGVVTYIPRMLPMVFLKKMSLSPSLKRFLEFVPYTVLASLIFPGILFSVEHTQSAIVGGLISIILAVLRVNLVFIVLGGIVGVYLSDLFILK
ncbi:AzlD domain-containing protein [Caldalkalibacillus mannanilyticus]|uniref:AzlD domain-containing protein n=1 Tax=Caldalkalibacillus mannanilyticus TaxID=1418 RepID=UPI000468DE06|nr:AzlD domain-containing protein [Caldalkalibacillus mannanilyticus]